MTKKYKQKLNKNKYKSGSLLKIGFFIQKQINKLIDKDCLTIDDHRSLYILSDLLIYVALRSGSYSDFLEDIVDELLSSSSSH